MKLKQLALWVCTNHGRTGAGMSQNLNDRIDERGSFSASGSADKRNSFPEIRGKAYMTQNILTGTRISKGNISKLNSALLRSLCFCSLP